MSVPQLDKLLALEDFKAKLANQGVGGICYCGYGMGNNGLWAIEVPSSISNGQYKKLTRVAVFNTRQDDARSVFDVRILEGDFHDVAYLTASGDLKRIFEAEQIPFFDRRNPQVLAKDALNYAIKLYESSLKL